MSNELMWSTVIDVFACEIAVSQNRSAIDAFMGIETNYPAAAGGGFIYDDENPYKMAIWISDNPGHGIIAHECLHAAIYILGKIGHPDINHSNDEVLAHLMQWLIEWIDDVAEFK